MLLALPFWRQKWKKIHKELPHSEPSTCAVFGFTWQVCLKHIPAANPQIGKQHSWTNRACRLLICFTESSASNSAFFRDSNFRDISPGAYGSWESPLSTVDRSHCGTDGETASFCSLTPCRNCFIKEGEWTLTSLQNQHDARMLWWNVTGLGLCSLNSVHHRGRQTNIHTIQ